MATATYSRWNIASTDGREKKETPMAEAQAAQEPTETTEGDGAAASPVDATEQAVDEIVRQQERSNARPPPNRPRSRKLRGNARPAGSQEKGAPFAEVESTSEPAEEAPVTQRKRGKVSQGKGAPAFKGIPLDAI
ncbi:MAG: hypothetical protein V3R34_08835, partial [Hyphomicrobium sp.]